MSSNTGDFYRAAGELGLGREEAELVAGLLGLEVRQKPVTRDKPPEIVIKDVDDRNGDKPVEQPPRAGSLRTRVVQKQTAAAEGEPEWFSSTTPFPLELTRHRRVQLPLEPLLLPRATRGIITTIAAMEVAEGTMDLERIVFHIARGEVVTELFRRKAYTTRNGLQLLIDRGDSMALFARDALWLERQLVRIIGVERVQPLRFSDLPQRGAGRAREEWSAYSPPAAGLPVLVVSDFGIGASAGTSTVQEWLEFAHVLREAGCPMIGLVPYPPRRWPEALAKALTLVQWDRRLHARAARTAVRLARKAVR